MDSIIKYIKRGDDLIIPDGVFFIPDKAFNRDHSFKRLIIGKDVSYIGRRAFSFCFGLKEVIFLPGSKCKKLLSKIHYKKVNYVDGDSKENGKTLKCRKK